MKVCLRVLAITAALVVVVNCGDPPKDAAPKIDVTRAQAEAGDASSQLLMALVASDGGNGGPKDPVQACKWFRLAADQGYANAQYMLGRSYVLGEGLQINYVEGYKWVFLAAAQNEQTAVKFRDALKEELTSGQIAEAIVLAREWNRIYRNTNSKGPMDIINGADLIEKTNPQK
jgi:TPR repeat protein